MRNLHAQRGDASSEPREKVKHKVSFNSALWSPDTQVRVVSETHSSKVFFPSFFFLDECLK